MWSFGVSLHKNSTMAATAQVPASLVLLSPKCDDAFTDISLYAIIPFFYFLATIKRLIQITFNLH